MSRKIDNNSASHFGSSGFPVKHGPPAPHGAVRHGHTLPQAQTGRNPHVTDGNDERFFGHVGTRRDQGNVAGEGRDSSGQAESVRRLRAGPSDKDGHAVYSSDVTAGGHATSDRIRGRTTRPIHQGMDKHDLAIASELHDYTK